ncbi:unnamed protein product [Rotaria socialis]
MRFVFRRAANALMKVTIHAEFEPLKSISEIVLLVADYLDESIGDAISSNISRVRFLSSTIYKQFQSLLIQISPRTFVSTNL